MLNTLSKNCDQTITRALLNGALVYANCDREPLYNERIIKQNEVKLIQGHKVCPYLKNKESAVRFCLWPPMNQNLNYGRQLLINQTE